MFSGIFSFYTSRTSTSVAWIQVLVLFMIQMLGSRNELICSKSQEAEDKQNPDCRILSSSSGRRRPCFPSHGGSGRLLSERNGSNIRKCGSRFWNQFL